MKAVKVPRPAYTFKHCREVAVADTVHTGGAQGLHEATVICETRYPYSRCPCGEYQVEWWM